MFTGLKEAIFLLSYIMILFVPPTLPLLDGWLLYFTSSGCFVIIFFLAIRNIYSVLIKKRKFTYRIFVYPLPMIILLSFPRHYNPRMIDEVPNICIFISQLYYIIFFFFSYCVTLLPNED